MEVDGCAVLACRFDGDSGDSLATTGTLHAGLLLVVANRGRVGYGTVAQQTRNDADGA